VVTSLVALASGAAAEEAAAAGAAASTGEATGFAFGSYGRVVASSNAEGGTGKRTSVVAHPARLDETTYLELDLGYRLHTDAWGDFRVVNTVAVTDALFHLDGDFDGALALRNSFVEASGFGVERLTLWAGSRMLRGDDIYLLDFWPLDNLNTVGGGGRYDFAAGTRVGLHLGVNQLRDPYQYQEVEVAAPDFGTETVVLMDRARVIGSARVEQPLELGRLGAKVVVYGEAHRLGEGVFEDAEQVRQTAPAETGYTAGAQLGAWGWGDRGFANLFVRHSTGIAAYGELSVPRGVALDRTVEEAGLTRVATSFGYGVGRFDLVGGGYLDWFHDADGVNYDIDDYYEGSVALRGSVKVAGPLRQAVEVSYQGRRPDGLNKRTGTFVTPAILKFAFMPTLSAGDGTLSRPELRLIYQLSLLNRGARTQYPDDDVRSGESVQHYVGIGAEWWFNSSTYQ
jgi:maltoporin